MLEERLSEELATLEKTGSLRKLRTICYKDSHCTINGKQLINLASNDYLGLGQSRDLLEKFISLKNNEGWNLSSFGSTSSRLLTGNFQVMDDLEHLLTSAYGKEAALTFNSGYHMNVGIVSALSSKNTLIVADKLVHASMIDGLMMSGAGFERFRHNDMEGLRRIIARHASSVDEIIIMVESIYSMDGDAANLKELVEIKKTYPDKIRLYVDEAHAVGVFGRKGLGLSEELGVMEDIDILCATFGKALAGMGGYIVTSKIVRDYLVNKSRPVIFSTALPPIVHEWNKFVFGQLAQLGDLRNSLRTKAQLIRTTAAEKGFDMPSDSQIIPFVFGENESAVKASKYLEDVGYFCPAIRPPTVPKGTARLRMSLTANLSIDKILRAIEALSTLKR